MSRTEPTRLKVASPRWSLRCVVSESPKRRFGSE